MFSRSKSVVGLDIGSSAVKAVELKAVGKGYKVALAAIRALAEIHSRQGELDEEKVYSAMAEFVVAEPGLHEAPLRPATDAPAATLVGVAAAEPVRPPTLSLPPVVSSIDTDALRDLDGFLVTILVARAQRERASLS